MEILQEIPDIIKYVLGLIITGVIGWFGHKALRKKTVVETDGIALDNNVKIRKMREEEIKNILNTIDVLEAELEEYKKQKVEDKRLIEQKERELAEAKMELFEVKRQLTKALIINTQLNAKK